MRFYFDVKIFQAFLIILFQGAGFPNLSAHNFSRPKKAILSSLLPQSIRSHDGVVGLLLFSSNVRLSSPFTHNPFLPAIFARAKNHLKVLYSFSQGEGPTPSGILSHRLGDGRVTAVGATLGTGHRPAAVGPLPCRRGTILHVTLDPRRPPPGRVNWNRVRRFPVPVA